MKHSLLLFTVVALVALAAAPARAQFMYIDADGDGVNSWSGAGDPLLPSTDHVDIWLNTTFNGDGSPASTANCGDGAFTMNSYEVILRSTNGSVTYGSWTDNLGFTTILGNAQAGPDFYVGRGSSTILSPGLYKLGSLALSGVSAGAVLYIVSSTSASPTALTSFGSLCVGIDFDNTLKLGSDWFDTKGTLFPDPATATTWGTIKSLYR